MKETWSSFIKFSINKQVTIAEIYFFIALKHILNCFLSGNLLSPYSRFLIFALKRYDYSYLIINAQYNYACDLFHFYIRTKQVESYLVTGKPKLPYFLHLTHIWAQFWCVCSLILKIIRTLTIANIVNQVVYEAQLSS